MAELSSSNSSGPNYHGGSLRNGGAAPMAELIYGAEGDPVHMPEHLLAHVKLVVGDEVASQRELHARPGVIPTAAAVRRPGRAVDPAAVRLREHRRAGDRSCAVSSLPRPPVPTADLSLTRETCTCSRRRATPPPGADTIGGLAAGGRPRSRAAGSRPACGRFSRRCQSLRPRAAGRIVGCRRLTMTESIADEDVAQQPTPSRIGARSAAERGPGRRHAATAGSAEATAWVGTIPGAICRRSTRARAAGEHA